jgi:hypothetical protein
MIRKHNHEVPKVIIQYFDQPLSELEITKNSIATMVVKTSSNTSRKNIEMLFDTPYKHAPTHKREK